MVNPLDHPDPPYLANPFDKGMLKMGILVDHKHNSFSQTDKPTPAVGQSSFGAMRARQVSGYASVSQCQNCEFQSSLPSNKAPAPSLSEVFSSAHEQDTQQLVPNPKNGIIGRPVIFDFPPGYLGFGGTGGNFRLLNTIADNPQQLLNPFDSNLPKVGYVMDNDPYGFHPPGPGVSIHQFQPQLPG